MHQDPFNCLTQLNLPNAEAQFYSLPSLKVEGSTPLEKLPFSIRVLLEQALRNVDDFQVNQEDVRALACWKAGTKSEQEIPFKPTRVILQDFTGVPAVVDLAAMRSAMIELGGNPDLINPRVPVDLIIDHSVQVDVSASPDAVQKNMEIEFERNRERYQFLKWGQQSFEQFRVFPPGVGIVHQVNLEHVAQVVQMRDGLCFPDTLVGTDSHTTMVNGLGVMGLGSRRNRGRISDAWPACFDVDSGSGWLSPLRAVTGRGDGDRPGSEDCRDVASERSGREIRRVFRDRTFCPASCGPSHRGQHGSGIWCNYGIFPDRF